jgi:hypothetical protein
MVIYNEQTDVESEEGEIDPSILYEAAAQLRRDELAELNAANDNDDVSLVEYSPTVTNNRKRKTGKGGRPAKGSITGAKKAAKKTSTTALTVSTKRRYGGRGKGRQIEVSKKTRGPAECRLVEDKKKRDASLFKRWGSLQKKIIEFCARTGFDGFVSIRNPLTGQFFTTHNMQTAQLTEEQERMFGNAGRHHKFVEFCDDMMYQINGSHVTLRGKDVYEEVKDTSVVRTLPYEQPLASDPYFEYRTKNYTDLSNVLLETSKPKKRGRRPKDYNPNQIEATYESVTVSATRGSRTVAPSELDDESTTVTDTEESLMMNRTKRTATMSNNTNDYNNDHTMYGSDLGNMHGRRRMTVDEISGVRTRTTNVGTQDASNGLPVEPLFRTDITNVFYNGSMNISGPMYDNNFGDEELGSGFVPASYDMSSSLTQVQPSLSSTTVTSQVQSLPTTETTRAIVALPSSTTSNDTTRVQPSSPTSTFVKPRVGGYNSGRKRYGDNNNNSSGSQNMNDFVSKCMNVVEMTKSTLFPIIKSLERSKSLYNGQSSTYHTVDVKLAATVSITSTPPRSPYSNGVNNLPQSPDIRFIESLLSGGSSPSSYGQSSLSVSPCHIGMQYNSTHNVSGIDDIFGGFLSGMDKESCNLDPCFS